MKRIMAFIFPIMLMFLLCTPVYAAGTVSTVNAEAEEDTIHVWGTTENVTAAVAIQVLDEADNIVVMDSLTVLGDAFDGEISGLALTEGKTYSVRVADYDGGTWQVATATVPVSVTSVTVTPTSGTLTTAGETLQLNVGVLPDNASNRNVSWVSSNTNVATVDQTGKVTAVANGTAVITVTTQDGNKTATASITVNILPNNAGGGENPGDNGNNSDNGDNGNNSDNGNNGNNGDNGNNGNNGNNANSGNSGSGNVAENVSTKNDVNEANAQKISPKTGDESNLLVWSLMLIGVSAILVGIRLMKRRKDL